MAIKDIAFTCYPVTDMARARAFYEGMLGLSPATAYDMPDDCAWAEYEVGSSWFALGKFPGWTPSNEGANVAFEVDDFDATIACLRTADVKFRVEPFSTPVCQMAMIIDPDGTTVCIHKRKQ